MTLPNFLIIGANKAGTTSVYHYLRQHPQIYMSPNKEPSFFSAEGDRVDRANLFTKEIVNNLKDYEFLFNGVKNEKAIGEASTAYLFCTGKGSADCVPKIKQYLPNVKMIAILRDPIERAYSAYTVAKHVGFIKESFPKIVQYELHDVPNQFYFLARGYYFKMLQRYFQFFDPAQIKIFLYEDLQNNPLKLLRDIFEFLGVNPSFVPDISKKYNVTSDVTASQGIFLKSIRQRISFYKEARESVLRRKFTPIYRADILMLQDLLGRDLSAWLK